jgi:AraC-like DNA-binding protein
MHAFSKEVGIPLRPYLRWLKLERAGSAIATGATLSDAAYAAGFADAAHMTRTFKGMLGVTPSEVRQRALRELAAQATAASAAVASAPRGRCPGGRRAESGSRPS